MGHFTPEYTDEEAQDSIGGILDDGTIGNIVFTYDDAGNTISAVTQDGEIDHDQLMNFVANEHIDWTNTSSDISTTGTGSSFGGITDTSITNHHVVFSKSGVLSGEARMTYDDDTDILEVWIVKTTALGVSGWTTNSIPFMAATDYFTEDTDFNFVSATDTLYVPNIINTMAADDTYAIYIDGVTNANTVAGTTYGIHTELENSSASGTHIGHKIGLDLLTTAGASTIGYGIWSDVSREATGSYSNTTGIGKMVAVIGNVTSNPVAYENTGAVNRTIVNDGVTGAVTVGGVMTQSGAGTIKQLARGGVFTAVGLASGDVISDTIGLRTSAQGSAAGTSTTYGVYAEASGADTNYTFYNASVAVDYAFYSLGGDVELTGGNLTTTGLGTFADVDLTDMKYSTPTYTSLHDWASITQSSGLISGGVISDATGGNINVTAGCGIAKTGAAEIDPAVFVDFDARNGIAIASGTKHTVYVDYDASPQVAVTTTPSVDIDHTTKFSIGSVFYDGTTMHILNEAGMRIYNLARRVHHRAKQLRRFERASGLVISDKGTRHFAITSGVIYAGLNSISITGVDTTTPTDYISWYYDADAGPAAWVTDTTNTQLDNVYYNDPETGAGDALLALGTNRYGVHWIYMDVDNHCNVIYGQGSYTLTQAQNSTPPAFIPPLLDQFAILIARVIVQEGEAEIIELSTAFDKLFAVSTPTQHDELGTLAWTSAGHTGTVSTLAGFDGAGAATNYTEANYILADGSRPMTANWNVGNFNLTTAGDITGDKVNINGLVGEIGGIVFIGSANGELQADNEALKWDNNNYKLIRGTLELTSGEITDTSGAISFGDENLSTTGAGTFGGGANAVQLTVTGNASQTADLVYVENSASDPLLVVTSTGQLGVGASPTANYRAHIVMASTDTTGLYVDGYTNGFTTSATDTKTMNVLSKIDLGAGGIIANHTAFQGTLAFTNDSIEVPVYKTCRALFFKLATGAPTITWTEATPVNLYFMSSDTVLDVDATFDSSAAGAAQVTLAGARSKVDVDCTFTDTGGNTPASTLTTYGSWIQLFSTPTLTSGSLTVENRGLNIDIAGNSAGNSTNYGIYFYRVRSADINWGIYDAEGLDHYFDGKIVLAQTDKNEFIASLNDGYIDIGATTAIRLLQDTNITGNLFLSENYSVQFRDALLYVNSDADGYLDLHADTAVRINTGLIIPSGTTPTPAVEGALYLDTDAGTNGTLVCYSNGAWRTVQALF